MRACRMPENKDSGGRRFVSAQDVAEHAGVSRSAVSRAFTPGASIAPATLARVQEAAFALGYQVNHLARGLHAHRSQLVGLVTSDPDTPFRAQMIAALSRALIERGNVPALISVGPTAGEVANAARQLLRYRAEATVFLSGSPPATLVDLTRRNGQTLILINRAETGVDSVRCDDQGGAQLAFEALPRPAPRLPWSTWRIRARACSRASGRSPPPRLASSAPATPTTRAGPAPLWRGTSGRGVLRQRSWRSGARLCAARGSSAETSRSSALAGRRVL